MAPDRAHARIEQLRDELRLTREGLGRLARDCASAAKLYGHVVPDNVALYGCAALLHAYYTALEHLLEAVAREFDADRPQGPEWHRRLLHTIASDRPERRPALLRSTTPASLEQLLRFRNLFRGFHSFDFDWTELSALLWRLREIHPTLDGDLETFDRFLASLLDAG